MGFPYYTGLVAIAIVAVGIGIFATTYEVTTYEDEQNLTNQLWLQTNDLENRFDKIREDYKVGIITSQEAYDGLKQLKTDAEVHLKIIEEKIKPLNTSHIYKNTQQLLVYLNEEIEIMAYIVN